MKWWQACDKKVLDLNLAAQVRRIREDNVPIGVIAVVSDGRCLATGVSVSAPGDAFDYKIGRAIALNRALLRLPGDTPKYNRRNRLSAWYACPAGAPKTPGDLVRAFMTRFFSDEFDSYQFLTVRLALARQEMIVKRAQARVENLARMAGRNPAVERQAGGKPTPEDFTTCDWSRALGEALQDARVTEGFSGSLVFGPGDIAEVIDAAEGENDGPRWLAVLRLRDGRYVYLVAGCDYTGWDCLAGGSCWFADSIENLLRFAMDDDGRARLSVCRGEKALT